MARVNQEIHAKTVRVIDADGQQFGIVPLNIALDEAKKKNLDLVEISPLADPPVCKIMDRGKYLFQMRKKESAARKKQKQVEKKQLRLRPNIEEGDYQVKLRNLIRFLESGHKVEVIVRFRGRELSHKQFGHEVLKRIQTDLASYADVEPVSSVESRQMMIVLVPKKK
jgi:translation initiation factor IF-3